MYIKNSFHSKKFGPGIRINPIDHKLLNLTPVPSNSVYLFMIGISTMTITLLMFT